jgi:formate/nitrite transporter FocA (FNT family)
MSQGKLPHPMLMLALGLAMGLMPMIGRFIPQHSPIPFPVFVGVILGGAVIVNYFYWRQWRKQR